MNRAELKALAKQQIKGNIGILFVIMLIIAGISLVGSYIPVVGAIAVALITPVLSVGLCSVYLKLTKGVKPEISELFAHLKKFWYAFKVSFLTGLFVSLWSLLFLIPGIVKAMAYSMAMYIVADQPEMSAREALKKSENIMQGHKMEFFVLQLSFIGWHLLGAVTFGLAYIYVLPYMSATVANFYNKIKPADLETYAPAELEAGEKGEAPKDETEDLVAQLDAELAGKGDFGAEPASEEEE